MEELLILFYMHIFKKVLSELLVLDIISNHLKSIGDYIKRLPHDGSGKMVLRKICNFAKIAPFQLNILNVVFYVIFIFLDSSYYKVQHIKHLERCSFSFGTIWV